MSVELLLRTKHMHARNRVGNQWLIKPRRSHASKLACCKTYVRCFEGLLVEGSSAGGWLVGLTTRRSACDRRVESVATVKTKQQAKNLEYQAKDSLERRAPSLAHGFTKDCSASQKEPVLSELLSNGTARNTCSNEHHTYVFQKRRPT